MSKMVPFALFSFYKRDNFKKQTVWSSPKCEYKDYILFFLTFRQKDYNNLETLETRSLVRERNSQRPIQNFKERNWQEICIHYLILKDTSDLVTVSTLVSK